MWRIAWILALWGLVGSPLPAPAQGAKDTLSVDLPGEPATLDPHVQWDTDSYHVYRNIFDNLVTRNPDGKIVPQIAKAWRYENDTTLVLDIRTDVKFHDGTPLTVDDVAWSVQRIIDPAFKSPQLSQFNSIVKAEAVGTDTVRLTTSSPVSGAASPARQAEHRAPRLRPEGRQREVQRRADGKRALPVRQLAEGRARHPGRQRELLARSAALQDGHLPDGAGHRDPDREPQDRARRHHPPAQSRRRGEPEGGVAAPDSLGPDRAHRLSVHQRARGTDQGRPRAARHRACHQPAAPHRRSARRLRPAGQHPAHAGELRLHRRHEGLPVRSDAGAAAPQGGRGGGRGDLLLHLARLRPAARPGDPADAAGGRAQGGHLADATSRPS